MSTNVSIEIDQDTANVLQMRAAELGITVPQLVAELATLDAELETPNPRRSPNWIVARRGRQLARVYLTTA
jgi:hypothetical protein